MRALALAVLFAALTVNALQKPAKAPAAADKPVAAKTKPKAVSPAKKNSDYGLQLLEIAEADAGGLEPGMRAFAMLQLARAYQSTDKPKALHLLEDAFVSAASMPEERRLSTREHLQQDILRAMVPLAPERADELLARVAPEFRGDVLNALLGYYEQNKQLDRALETVQRIAQTAEVPYGAAERIMAALKPEQTAEFQQVFALSLASFRDNKHDQGFRLGDGDFGQMVVHFWTRLPKETVRGAIDEILKQAEEADKNASSKPIFAVSSDKGAASFGSNYEYRLFQLMPVLRHIDESAAEDLLKKNQSVAALAKQYPDGLLPEAPSRGQGSGKGSGSKNMMNMSVSGTPADIGAKMAEMSRVQKIVGDAELHPQDALANMSSISLPDLRAAGYEAIARRTYKKQLSLAHTAIDKALESADKIDEADAQVRRLQGIASLYLQMGEDDNAKKVVEKGLKAAEKVYKADTNADDPNQALKAYWPSTDAYSAFLRLAGKISPVWALTLLKEIPDDEIKAVAETSLATAWLGLPPGPSTVMKMGKSNSQMMTTERAD